MQVVLLERIAKLGQMGDLVTVKDGYARNFLLPKGKALRANEDNLKRFENERAQLEAKSLEHKSEAETVKAKLNGESIIIIRQSSETGQLYGSVNPRDIADTLEENGFSLNRNQIALEEPIKTLGLHNTTVILHPEVEAVVTVNVARTQDEAERQARGEDVTVEQNEEKTIAVKEIFEEGVNAKLVSEEVSEAETAKAETAEAETAKAETAEEEEKSEK